MIAPSLTLLVPSFIIALSFLLQKYFPKETTASSPKYSMSSIAEMTSFCTEVDDSGSDYETRISTLRAGMSKVEVGKIDMREVEEVGIGVLVCE